MLGEASLPSAFAAKSDGTRETHAMKRIISTTQAPAAVGPYSQAVDAGGMVFVSGQIPLDAATGALVPGDISAQTEQVMKNLEAVLTAAALTFADVVRCTIYITNMADFAAVNSVYATRFPTHPPARATVQVGALPKGAQVEIDAIAVRR